MNQSKRGHALTCVAILWSFQSVFLANADEGIGLLYELSGYVGPGPIQNVVIPEGVWPSDGAPAIKQLAALLEVADLNDSEMVLQLNEAADLNGFIDIGDVLSDLHQAVSASNVEAIAKLNDKLADLVDLHLASLLDQGGEQGGVAAPPVNDLCASAITVAIPSSTAGTLVESTNDAAPACNICQTTGGVWYKVVGTGNRITASLCNAGTTFDSKMSVYTGTCGTLTCVDGNDDLGTAGAFPYACALSGTRSAVTWCSTLGTEYYILVHSFSTLAGFSIDLSEDLTACTPPANETCPAAVVVNQGSLPQTDTGVVIRQAHDDLDVTCNTGTCPVTRRGVWYTYTPTSATSVVISTSISGVHKAIFVGSCGGLVQALCSTAQTLGVSGLTPGTQYWILLGITSDFSEPNPTTPMNVTFSLPPDNDLCTAATTVAVPSSTTGTTVNSFADAAGTCNAITNANAGVWYRVIGTGNTITADTCAAGAAGTLADTRISVYSCGCSVRQCITANDTASPSCVGFTSRARASWCSEVGKEYLVLVHQGTTTAGTFRLDMTDNGTSCTGPVACPVCGNNVIETGETCDGSALGTCVNGCTASCQCAAPANDNCANAAPVLDGVVLLNRAFATTDGVAQPNPPCDFPTGDDQLYNDVWFNYTASCTGRLLVDTCNGAGLDTRLAIYPGCGCPAVADPISCNDDSGAAGELTDPDQDPDTCNQAGNSPFESATRNQVVQGQCYKIRLGAFSSTPASSVGADELFIQCIAKGSCCDANGACTAGVIASECPGTLFLGADCTPESCCISGSCSMLAPECCQSLGGTPGGPGSACGTCGDGIVGCGEQCDGGSCCSANCLITGAGTPCRGSAGPCDAVEMCDGVSSACPADGFTTGNACRPAAGDCDAPESCDGTGPACPADMYLSGNTCRTSAGPCDPPEICSGLAADCPPDLVITSCVDGDGCCPPGCNGNTDSDCPPVAVPTVSEWGLAFLTLIGLAVGSLVFKRRATNS